MARWEIGEAPMGKAESMGLLSEQPKLAKELATKFARPGPFNATPPCEIKLGGGIRGSKSR